MLPVTCRRVCCRVFSTGSRTVAAAPTEINSLRRLLHRWNEDAVVRARTVSAATCVATWHAMTAQLPRVDATWESLFAFALAKRGAVHELENWLATRSPPAAHLFTADISNARLLALVRAHGRCNTAVMQLFLQLRTQVSIPADVCGLPVFPSPVTYSILLGGCRDREMAEQLWTDAIQRDGIVPDAIMWTSYLHAQFQALPLSAGDESHSVITLARATLSAMAAWNVAPTGSVWNIIIAHALRHKTPVATLWRLLVDLEHYDPPLPVAAGAAQVLFMDSPSSKPSEVTPHPSQILPDHNLAVSSRQTISADISQSNRHLPLELSAITLLCRACRQEGAEHVHTRMHCVCCRCCCCYCFSSYMCF
jgi:hypothetical protein